MSSLPATTEFKPNTAKEYQFTMYVYHPDKKSVADARRWLKDILINYYNLPLGKPVEDFFSACGEAINNAYEHGKEPFYCYVDYDGEVVKVEVIDFGGGWTPPVNPVMPGPESERGRGIALMHLLCDTVEITATGSLTRCTLTKRIGR